MLIPFDLFQAERQVLYKFGQAAAGLLLQLFGFLIQHGEAVKGNDVAGCLKKVILRLDIRLNGLLHTVGHLAGKKALPDEPVQLILIRRQAVFDLVRRKAWVCGTDRLVAVLRIGTRFVVTGGFGKIFFAPAPADILCSRLNRFFGDPEGVGAHIGYKAGRPEAFDLDALIQFLCRTHGPARLKTEFAGCLLLHGGCGKRRNGRTAARPLFHIGHGVFSILQIGEDAVRFFLIGNFYFTVFIAVQRGGKDLTGAFREKFGVDRPVFFRDKSMDLLFPVNDNAYGNRLHTARRKPMADFLRKERAELVADEAVENAARLLGIDEVQVNAAGMFHSGLNTAFCYFIERHAVLVFRIQPEDIGKMPGNGFALAVGVRCKKN